MNYHLHSLLILVVTYSNISLSQVYADSGDYTFLKGQSLLNIEFEYDGMTVGKKTEPEYVDDKIYEYNQEEEDKGYEWFEGWVKARKERYEPDFTRALQMELKNVNIKVGNGAAATYTLIVNTTHTEPGFYAVKVNRLAHCNYRFIFKENESQNEYEFVLNGVSQEFTAFAQVDVVKRISLCYLKAGRKLGSFILKSID